MSKKITLRVPYEGSGGETVRKVHNFLATVRADEEVVEETEDGGCFVTERFGDKIEFTISVGAEHVDIVFDHTIPAFTIARRIATYIVEAKLSPE